MTPETEALLRARVDATLAGAGLDGATRADLAEELMGHLVERWQAHATGGLDEAGAAQRAIAEFGASGEIGRELGRTYHSRLWVSTIGVLLPAISPASRRPQAVAWLRLAMAITWILMAQALVLVLVEATPGRALLGGAALVAGLIVLAIAFQAVARGQRWALWYAIAIVVLMVVAGLWNTITSGPTTIAIPLGSLFGLFVLAFARRSWLELRPFVSGSAPVRGGLAVVLAASIGAPSLLPPLLAALPDPTQASAADLTLRLSMTCDHGPVPMGAGTPPVDGQRAIVVADMTWRRTDMLARGLLRSFVPADDADSAGIRTDDAGPGAITAADGSFWMLPTDEPTVIDTTTGATAGWWGSTSASVALLPETIAGSLTIGIDQAAIQPGHTIRATWLVVPPTGMEAPWPRFEVVYAHLDRFLVEGTVGCGQTTFGREASRGAPVP